MGNSYNAYNIETATWLFSLGRAVHVQIPSELQGHWLVDVHKEPSLFKEPSTLHEQSKIKFIKTINKI